MDHLGAEKLASYDKALGAANAAIKSAFGKDSGVAFDGHGNAVAAITGNGAEVRQKTDVALSDQGKSAADKGGQTSVGDLSQVASGSAATLENISGMTSAQIDAEFASQNPADMFADNNDSHPLGYYLPSLPDGAVNAVTGFGDAEGFGLPSLIRDLVGIDGGVNKDSMAYQTGNLVGTFTPGIGTAAALRGTAFVADTAAARALPFLNKLNRNPYIRIGGGRMPANGGFPAGTDVPRISIGPGPGNPHIDLRTWPIDGP